MLQEWLEGCLPGLDFLTCRDLGRLLCARRWPAHAAEKAWDGMLRATVPEVRRRPHAVLLRRGPTHATSVDSRLLPRRQRSRFLLQLLAGLPQIDSPAFRPGAKI